MMAGILHSGFVVSDIEKAVTVRIRAPSSASVMWRSRPHSSKCRGLRRCRRRTC